MTDAVKPLPCCPFCGSEPHQTIDRADEHSEWYSCQNHECPIYAVGMTWKQWNRRTPPAGWKPIETAPKDATRILAYGGDKHQPLKVEVVHWHYGAWVPDGYTHGVIFKDHTHWMPLPAALENET